MVDNIATGSEHALSLCRGSGNAGALGASGGNRPNVVPLGEMELQTEQQNNAAQYSYATVNGRFTMNIRRFVRQNPTWTPC